MNLDQYIKKVAFVSEQKLPNGNIINYYHIYFNIDDLCNPKGIFIQEIIDQENKYSYGIKPFGFIPSSNNCFIFDVKHDKSIEVLERKMNIFKNLNDNELKQILNTCRNEQKC